MQEAVIDKVPDAVSQPRAVSWVVTPAVERQYVISRSRVDRVESGREALGVLMVYLGLWLFFELMTTGFMLAYLFTPSFAYIQGFGCPIINPATGKAQTRFALQVYMGFSGQEDVCEKSQTCIRWDDTTAWSRFQQAASSPSVFTDTTSTLSSAQSLVPCGLAFLLVALALHGYLIVNPTGHGPSQSIWLYHMASWSLLLSWTLVLVAQSEILYAPPFIPLLWTRFFRKGYNLEYLTSAELLPPPTSADAAAAFGCNVVGLYNGGTWLAVSVGLLFFLLWFSIIAGCCLKPLLVAADGVSSS